MGNSKQFLLGIDVGTTLIKSVLFDTNGEQLANASASVGLDHPNPGWAEQDMEAVWSATAETIREAVASATRLGGEIAAVSVSGQGGGLWLVDKNGRPVRKGITWLDGRSGKDFSEWKETGLLEKIDRLTGYHIFPGVGPLTLFHWFKHNDPAVLEKAACHLWAKDWVKYCLTGEISTDESDPSNGHFLRGERTYGKKLFEMLGVGEYLDLLPPIVPSWQVMGRVTKHTASNTGLAVDTPVASGAWDVSSTGLGAGCVKEGQALSILGTAGVHLAVSNKAPADEKATYSICVHCVPDRWVVNSMAMTATANLDWFLREAAQADRLEAEEQNRNFYEIVNEKVSSSPIGAGGILYLPFLQGERAPFLKPSARGVFFGMSNATTRADMIRAIYEGVAFSTLHNYESIERAIPIREVVLAGGGSKSQVWSQILSDCTNKPMRIPAGEEFGALGAALNAAVAVGIFSNHQQAVEKIAMARTHKPDPTANAQYRNYYEVYRFLIESCWEAWDRLATLV